MRVLVTGAGGFVGSWLLRRLSSAFPGGVEVTALGYGTPGGGAVPELDITDAAAVDALVNRLRPGAVVHLAAVASAAEAREGARRAWDVNLYGTMNLAEAVMRHAPEARFIFAGSSEAYGGSFKLNDGILDEDAALNPRNAYATTKAAADLMLGQMAEENLRAVRFRPFNHTGPGQSVRFVVPAFAAQIAAIERGEQPPVIRVGNLEARRDFLDVRDVVDAYGLAISASALPRGVVFNLASGIPRRIGDILGTLLSMSHVPIRVEQDKHLMRASDSPVTAGTARRATELLGWRQAIPWETTLHDVLESHRRSRAPGAPTMTSPAMGAKIYDE